MEAEVKHCFLPVLVAVFAFFPFLSTNGVQADTNSSAIAANVASRTGSTTADFEQHAAKLQKKIAGRDFAVVIEPPFVVIGDDSLEATRKRSEQTVKWAVKMLKQDFFKKDPDTIIDIWLFKDKESYEKNTFGLFKRKPTTPFGFYSDEHNALIMDISTGGGTLVHEIVHPFMRANVPDCPAWLNEGLGSLYEQSEEKNGHIHGRTNWRLAGLKKAIKADTLPSFEDLFNMTDTDFYGTERGDNYAQARYLLYYLQEQGKLVDFFKEYLANRAKDASGIATLRKILGEDDLSAFKKKWETYVMKLTFP